MEINDITNMVIGAAMKIHSAIGPGVLESVYRKCLQHELHKSGLAVQAEMKLPVLYDGRVLESGYRLDLLVQNQVVIELKCVDDLLPIHKAQLLTYLRLANKSIGLLLNFNVVHMRDGIRRILNNRHQAPLAAGQS